MIVDHDGKPISTGEVLNDEPQTARVAYLHRDFAQHPGRGLTPGRLARILEDAERGDLVAQSDLGDDLEERDAHIHAELSKRRRAVLTATVQYEPPRNATPVEQRATDFVTELMEDVDLDEILLSMGDAINKGFAPLELEWQRVGGQYVPNAVLKPQRWFQMPQLNPYTDEIRLRDATVDGAELIPGGWIVHIHKAKPGYLPRAALSRILSWPYLFKNYSTRDMAEFLEIYGLPLRLGKYPVAASDDEKSALMRAVMSIGHAAAGIVPQGMEIDFQEATTGASEPFSAMIKWCENTESKAILGQTLSGDAQSTGLGSGVANLQADVRDDILRSDCKQMAQSVSQLLYLIAVFNGYTIEPGRGPRCRLLVDDSEDITKFSAALPKIVAAGVPVPVSWARDRMRIPEPQDGEPILQLPRRSSPPQQPGKTAALKTAPDKADPPVPMTVQLEDDVDEATTAWIESIRELVDQADSLEALRDSLFTAFPSMGLSEYAAAMSQAFLAAELAGRSDIIDEMGSQRG